MKIIFRIISLLIVFFFLFVLHLTFIGIETDKFNKQIQNKVRDINQNLEVKLKQIKIILSPLNLKLNVKTVGSEFILNEKVIEIESIKSDISLLSFFQKEYSIENLELSTKSLDIKNIISFIRKLNNIPELFILEKITKKGYLIANIKLNFDKNGKIKNDFEIKGLIKNLSLHILKEYKIDKSDLTFNYQKDNLTLNNIDSSINDKKLIAKKIQIKKEINNFYVNGDFDLNKLNFNKKELNNLFKF